MCDGGCVVRILFLCTGNLCRSPSAERIMRRRLEEVGPHSAVVASAGIMATTMAVPAPLLAEASARGIDLGTHQPHRVDLDAVSAADLVVGMARPHVREVVLADATAFAKSFTLRDLVRRGSARGRRARKQPVAEWLAFVGEGRRQVDLIGESAMDDIPDPMGGPAAGYRAMLEEVGSLTLDLHALLWPHRQEDVSLT